MPGPAEDETTVNDSYSVTIPEAIRERVDIEASDKIRWHVDDDGALSVEVVKQEMGVFDDFESVSMGGSVVGRHDETERR
jgi:bifunctional DNA-binding transcriptional regulator/antitoxin component of YhaV-PrlF toxin-antitoxin module